MQANGYRSLFSDQSLLKLDFPELPIADHVADRKKHSVGVVAFLHFGSQLAESHLGTDTYPLTNCLLDTLHLSSHVVSHHQAELSPFQALHGRLLEEIVGLVDFLGPYLVLQLHASQGFT